MPESSIPFDQLPPEIKSGIVNKCSSTECQTAKANLSDIRNLIVAACTKAAEARGLRDAYAAIAAVLLTVVTGLLAAAGAASATIFGIPAAVVLIIIAAAFFIAFGIVAGIAAGWQGAINAANKEIAALQQTFMDEVKKMRSSCSEYCYADSLLPTCSN